MIMGGQQRDYQPIFDAILCEQSKDYTKSDDRLLFHYLVNIEQHPGVLVVAYNKLLAYCEKVEHSRDNTTSPYSNALLEEFLSDAIEKRQSVEAATPYQCKNILRQYTPTALVEGCWLQSTSQAATCHTELASSLFKIFGFLAGNGNSLRHMGNRYRTLLNLLEFDVPKVTSWKFSEQPDTLDRAFEPPVIQLCLAQFPRCFLPEILGYTLAHVFGLSRFFQVVTTESLDLIGLSPIYLMLHLEGKKVLELRDITIEGVKTYLRQYAADSNKQSQQWQRILSGFTLYQEAERKLFDTITYSIKHPLSLRTQVLALFTQKSSFAIGHHHGVKLDNRNLDDWFGAIEGNGDSFLNALLASDYFDLDAPSESKFIRETTAFGGSMFGVFNQNDLDLIQQWMTHERQRKPVILRTGIGNSIGRIREKKSTPIKMRRNQKNPAKTIKKSEMREMFHTLVNVDLFPHALPLAKQFVIKILRKSTAKLNKNRSNTLQYFEYDVETFERRILDIYNREMSSYKPFVSPPKLDRAVYLWAIEQFAPTILTDGCWLQKTSQAGINFEEINARLFRIFADEIGDGHVEWNHPNVYRNLLSSLKIKLPELDTKDFAYYPNFSTAAFDLPVFMLSISQFPTHFLPEILGLNLAIELSGLGAAYMGLADELDYWDIDSTIIKLHISIDNMANGHSFIAKDTIAIYLDEQLSAYGHLRMQQQWRRIWIGFLALQVSLERFKRVMAWTYFKRFKIPVWYHDLSMGETNIF